MWMLPKPIIWQPVPALSEIYSTVNCSQNLSSQLPNQSAPTILAYQVDLILFQGVEL